MNYDLLKQNVPVDFQIIYDLHGNFELIIIRKDEEGDRKNIRIGKNEAKEILGIINKSSSLEKRFIPIACPCRDFLKDVEYVAKKTAIKYKAVCLHQDDFGSYYSALIDQNNQKRKLGLGLGIYIALCLEIDIWADAEIF